MPRSIFRPAVSELVGRHGWLSALGKYGWLLLAAPLGLVIYRFLQPWAQWLTEHAFGLPLGSRLGSAVAFFLYDAPALLFLLAVTGLAAGFIQSFLNPERVHAALAGRREGTGNVLASLFGVVIPVCSCSVVPLLVGLLRAGVPLGVSFSFLVAAPLVNKVVLVMLLGLAGWKVAAVFAAAGLSLALVSGLVLGRLKMEHLIQPWVGSLPAAPESREGVPALRDRLKMAKAGMRDTVARVWPWLLAGIGVGAFIHGYVPMEIMARILGSDSWWSVPLAVLVGMPLYAAAITLLPIVGTLLAKGAALGTTLAFMMAVLALSPPQFIILRQVLKPRLLAALAGVVVAGILAVGYLLSFVL